MAKDKRSYNDRKEYFSSYYSSNYKQIKISLSPVTEEDILEKLDSVDNKRQYIISLIRADISNHSKEKTRE